MKRVRLRGWVKVVIALSIIVGVVIFADKYTQDQIDRCVAGGHSQTYCENNLSIWKEKYEKREISY